MCSQLFKLEEKQGTSDFTGCSKLGTGTGTGSELRRPFGYSAGGGLILNEAPRAGGGAE
jgi:hypothetical protein